MSSRKHPAALPAGLAAWLILSGLLLRAAAPFLQLWGASGTFRASLLAGDSDLLAQLMLGVTLLPALLPIGLAGAWVWQARSILAGTGLAADSRWAPGQGQRLLGLGVWTALLAEALSVLALPLWSLPALLAAPLSGEVAISPASAASYGWRGYLMLQALLVLLALLLATLVWRRLRIGGAYTSAGRVGRASRSEVLALWLGLVGLMLAALALPAEPLLGLAQTLSPALDGAAPGLAARAGALGLHLLPALIGLGLAALAMSPLESWLAEQGRDLDAIRGASWAGRTLRWLVLAAFLRWPGDLVARSLRPPHLASELWPALLIVAGALIWILWRREQGQLPDEARLDA